MRSLSLRSFGHAAAVLAAMYTVTACGGGESAVTPKPGAGGQVGVGGATVGTSATGGSTQGNGGATGTSVISSTSSSATGGTSSSSAVTTGGVPGGGGTTTQAGTGGKGAGGATAVAGAGGKATGGAAAGGASAKATGGVAAGGAAVGGAGGKATGGAAAGGAATGGTKAATGGASAAVGGNNTAGSSAGDPVTCEGETPCSISTTLPPAGDFTDTVGSASVEMIAIPGGSFTLGCESSSGCDADTTAVSNITVSDYHIMKGHATNALWTAAGLKEGTWYDCMALATELAKKTGHAYRIMTEAEFEFAAKKYLSKLSDVTASEEWAFNSWETKYSCKSGDVDPVGPFPGSHTQKTRRDKGSGDKITGRLIRSIDGIGPKCRLTISDKTEYPPKYPPTCSIKPPVMGPEPENSYRDQRWVTGDSTKWVTGPIAMGNFDLQVWDDGSALMNKKPGQWFTSNNITFVFVPSSGTSVKYPYIFLDCKQGSVLSETSFMNGGFIGRFEKSKDGVAAKPTVSGLKSGAELAAAAGADFAMVDMQNVPESARVKDSRLIDTTSNCWFQNNISAGGTHNYRKDVDADEFRFAVIDGGTITMLANGNWWTVNNTFLHIEHSTGYVGEYLYVIGSDGRFYHNSFMGYERADFRMFEKYDNSAPKGTATGNFPPTCVDDSCSKELAKGAAAPFYSTMGDSGKSTFKPASCPAGGCQ